MMFELAWQFGCTVEELGDRMSSHEMVWWRAYFQLRHEEQKRDSGQGRIDLTDD